MGIESVATFAQQRRDRKSRPRQKRERPVKIASVGPTSEQQSRNNFQSAGMAYRKTPVIDTLLKRGKITKQQHDALAHYRDQATAADRSPIKSNIDFTVRTGGNSRPIGYETPQQTETKLIEAGLGRLQPLARAIAVDDVTISEWCVAQYGGREVRRGKRVSIEPSRSHVEAALYELRDIAGRIGVMRQ